MEFLRNYIALSRITDELNKLVFDFCLLAKATRLLGECSLKNYSLNEIIEYVGDNCSPSDVYDADDMLDDIRKGIIMDYLNSRYDLGEILEDYDICDVLDSYEKSDVFDCYDTSDMIRYITDRMYRSEVAENIVNEIGCNELLGNISKYDLIEYIKDNYDLDDVVEFV